MMMMEGKTMIIKAIDEDDEGDDNDYQSQVRRKRKHDKNFGRGNNDDVM